MDVMYRNPSRSKRLASTSGQAVFDSASSSGYIWPKYAESPMITVPLGVLKAGRIRLTPALPTDVQRALDGLAMGALTKIALRFPGQTFDAPPEMFPGPWSVTTA